MGAKEILMTFMSTPMMMWFKMRNKISAKRKWKGLPQNMDTLTSCVPSANRVPDEVLLEESNLFFLVWIWFPS